MVVIRGVKLNRVRFGTSDRSTVMSEQQFDKEKTTAFLNEMHALFSKHAAVMLGADGRLAAFDLDGFKAAYKDLPKEDLLEIVMAQHIKTNEIYDEMVKRSNTIMNILQDMSSCKDFVAFDDLRKRARSILLAQDMVNRGKSPDEVRKIIEEQSQGKATSNIIVQ